MFNVHGFKKLRPVAKCMILLISLSNFNYGSKELYLNFYSRQNLFQFMINKKTHLHDLDKRACDKSGWSTSVAVSFDSKLYI